MESIPTFDNRAFRKNLAGHGLIYLGCEEYEIHLLNLSLTGLLAELKYDANLHNVKDLFEVLKISPLIDIYLPEMRLAGEAQIVRVATIDGGFKIGIEFRNLSCEVDDLLYKRKVYRKNLSAEGNIVFNGVNYTFKTENVSVYGLMVRLRELVSIEVGTVAGFDFEHLKLSGEVEVVWVDQDRSSTLIGLRYINMQAEQIKGVPKFELY